MGDGSGAEPGAGARAVQRLPVTKYWVEDAPAGERFELSTSSRTAPDGKYRFVWTLAPGKRGPGEHYHETETETFEIVSGVLRIWLRGEAKDYGPGETVAIPPNVPHRFLNPGSEPVVVNVSLDGPKMEDAFAPLAVHTHGRKPTMGEMGRFLVLLVHTRPSTPTSAPVRALFTAFAAALRLVGVKPFEPVRGWDVERA